MKTQNKHPQWYNEPLRLSTEQKQNPILVIADFFEWYHLQDVKEILWTWTKTVISSPTSISNEPLDRGNHICFYENIETLIEATFIIVRNSQEKVKKKKRKK